MYRSINNLKLVLASGYTAGSGTATVADAGGLGTPSGSAPVLLTGFAASAPTVPLFDVPVTGVAGNVLTLGAVTWGTDTSLAAADLLIATWTAEAVDELQAAITTKADTSSLGTMAAEDAASYYDKAATDSRIGEAILPLMPTATANATFAPINHTHLIADVSGLQTALDAKAADSAVVHLAGAETISGDKTHSGALYVTRNGGANLVFRALTDGNGCYMGDRLSVNGLTAIPSAGGIELASGAGLVWTANPASSGGTKDTGLVRDSAGVLKVTDGSTGLGQIKANGALLTGIPRLLFSSSQRVTVANSNVETTLLGAGLGSLTIPANTLRPGVCLIVKGWAIYSSGSTTPLLSLYLYLGSTLVVPPQGGGLTSNATNYLIWYDAIVTCQSAGVSGSVEGQGASIKWISNGNSTKQMPHNNASPITIDTTAPLTADLRARWNLADPALSITQTNFTLQILEL